MTFRFGAKFNATFAFVAKQCMPQSTCPINYCWIEFKLLLSSKIISLSLCSEGEIVKWIFILPFINVLVVVLWLFLCKTAAVCCVCCSRVCVPTPELHRKESYQVSTGKFQRLLVACPGFWHQPAFLGSQMNRWSSFGKCGCLLLCHWNHPKQRRAVLAWTPTAVLIFIWSLQMPCT